MLLVSIRMLYLLALALPGFDDPVLLTRKRYRPAPAIRGHDSAGRTLENISGAWIVQADFLLADVNARFNYVIGNPPYVRQELVDPSAPSLYRQIYRTVLGRADLYARLLSGHLPS